jgi:RimJ/RimL family protein N-acetyltransferase
VAAALRTARLLLRQWCDDDVAAFAELSADPAVMQYLVPFADRTARDAWVVAARKHWQDHGGPWVLEVPSEGLMIGVVGLNNLRFALPFAPAVEVAWRLTPRYWGRGYAHEAARAAIDDGFGRLGLKEIVAFTVPANLASQRVMEKVRDDPRSCRGFRFRASATAAGAPVATPCPLPASAVVSGLILLVRHGETEWNRERRNQGRFDSPLTERGYRASPCHRAADRGVAECCGGPHCRQPTGPRAADGRNH